VRLVVFAWGNEARGDDGFGPAIADHLAGHRPDIPCITDDQLQLEHALDLKDCDLALFVDAGRGTPAPFSFQETFARGGLAHTSHALSPEALLGVAERIGVTPPPAYVLCIAGVDFELGAPLSDTGRSHLAAATEFLDRLLARQDVATWRRNLTSTTVGAPAA
jgi:hydrogenase maturation protease